MKNHAFIFSAIFIAGALFPLPEFLDKTSFRKALAERKRVEKFCSENLERKLFLVGRTTHQTDSTNLLKPLEGLIGNWKIEASMRLSKNGPWENSAARSTIEKAVGELIFEEHYSGTKQGRPYTLRAWLGNDNRTTLYQRVAVDSDHGVLTVYEGTFANDTLTLKTIVVINGITLHLRVQYFLNFPDAFTVETSRSIDGNGWDLTSRLKYSRLK